MPPEPRSSAADEEARISTEIAALHDASFGGSASLDTHCLPDAVFCVIDLPLLRAEETLLTGAAGAELVRDGRREFEHSLSSHLTAIVEHTTGRRVIAFLTDSYVDPPMTVNVFRLAAAARQPEA